MVGGGGRGGGDGDGESRELENPFGSQEAGRTGGMGGKKTDEGKEEDGIGGRLTLKGGSGVHLGLYGRGVIVRLAERDKTRPEKKSQDNCCFLLKIYLIPGLEKGDL